MIDQTRPATRKSQILFQVTTQLVWEKSYALVKIYLTERINQDS